MKNTFINIFIFILFICSLQNQLQASTVDLSNCNTQSSFAIVTQSEGPTYACGGIDTGVGNPINVLNGNKFEQVDDFKAPPAYEGLSFSRYYNSHSQAFTPMGYGWYSAFDIKLYEQPDIIQVRLETGKRINFIKTKVPMQDQSYVIRGLSQDPKEGWVERRIDGSGWIWHKSHTTYHFEAVAKDPQLGHLVQVRSEKEAIYTLRYDQQDRLTRVENARGNALSWRYQYTKYGLPQITVTTPVGAYEYFLDRNNNLVQVVYPNGTRLKYAYDPKDQGGDIHNLTGKYIFYNQKWKVISKWKYDSQDRAISSVHDNNLEQIAIDYDPRLRNYKIAQNGVFVNTVTNSLGEKTKYSYQISGTQFQLVEVLGLGCSSCHTLNKKYHYTDQGLIDYVGELDHHGSVVQSINLKYDEHGNIISKRLDSNSASPQTTSYDYEVYTTSPQKDFLNTENGINKRLIKETRQSVLGGNKKYIKYYSYNTNNQLIKIKEDGFTPLGEAISKTKKLWLQSCWSNHLANNICWSAELCN
ncbi:DUF6531 domain-containing protein [Acinetobacter boissieri]|uniref:YD repeat-containing protein n=1 Tax=Acinetobacter boissieri TaxID=1219383 RepID=A0A1G6JTA5_9GAMM|nr:DUF6531 domain-containing protein [Acinetobacter boissieri]SDC21917.1 YD repeat-containing protein [Acinetobacter boissieri]